MLSTDAGHSTIGDRRHSTRDFRRTVTWGGSIQDHVSTSGDGRLQLDVGEGAIRALGHSVSANLARRSSSNKPSSGLQPLAPEPRQPQSTPKPNLNPNNNTQEFPVKLNIVIQVVGSRGDVQPFVALGNELQRHGHRVRLATHDVFESFVREANLDFFPVGGDPAELMAYMVRNPGLIPSLDSIKARDVQKKRSMVAAMLRRFWLSCIEPDPYSTDPFVADAIIANPPSFAHIHCAQALGIPLHLMFTMPWSSTSAFPHPLVNINLGGDGKADISEANYLSYVLVEFLTWQGLGDVINEWRLGLDLEPILFSEGPRLAETLKVPFTYCWSPALVPKPQDWGSHIDVCGFFFRNAPSYEPPEKLALFLSSGPPPLYIGFGSIVIDDPAALSAMLIEAIRVIGTRALISRGWSKLSGPESDQVMFLDDCPHEWLFQRVSAVVHHGGAGTTACGLSFGKPTAIIPFFGDQPFWANMVAAAGAGPAPIPQKSVTVEKLVKAIKYCLSPEAEESASIIAQKMREECGVKQAAMSFHSQLPRDTIECEVVKGQAAFWTYSSGGCRIRLSRVAAEILVRHHRLDSRRLKRCETRRLIIRKTHWDPFTATIAAALVTVVNVTKAVARVIIRPAKTFLRRRQADEEDGIALARSSEDGREAEHGHKPTRSYNELAARFLLAMLAAFGSLIVALLAGIAVIPFAFTEGFRSLPRLVGQDVRYIGEVRDVQSGLVLGAFLVFFMLHDSLTGLVLVPYRTVRRLGPLGLIAGVFAAVFTMGVNMIALATGIGAYPLMGLYKTVWHMTNRSTRDSIARAGFTEGQFLVKRMEVDDQQVISGFDALRWQRQDVSYAHAVVSWARQWRT